MKKYFKVFTLSVKNYISFPLLLKSIFEYSFYFILLNIVFRNIKYFSGNSIQEIYLISGSYIPTIFLYKLFYENALFLRYLIVTDHLDKILLKPINPLFRILTNSLDFASLVIATLSLITILYFGSFQNSILIIVGIIISFAIFILVLSLLLITSGKYFMEKLLMALFLIGFVGITNTIGLLSSILF